MQLNKQDILDQFKELAERCNVNDYNAWLCIFLYGNETYQLNHNFEEYLLNENILKHKDDTINSLFGNDEIPIEIINGFRVTILEDFLDKCL